MTTHVNFYENINEARMRLRGTVVLYGGLPYTVLAVCDGHSDGIFRIYLLPVGLEVAWHVPPLDQYPADHPGLGPAMDKWIAGGKTPVIRKQMNSPLFNRFRPFPLGMCNDGGQVYYLARQPTRKTEQGLTRSGITETQLSGGKPEPRNGLTNIAMMGPAMRDTIVGDYPSVGSCIDALTGDTVTNTGLAFHREFALVRGPVDLLLLAYRDDYVGVLVNDDLSRLRLGPRFGYAKEACEELGIFGQVI